MDHDDRYDELCTCLVSSTSQCRRSSTGGTFHVDPNCMSERTWEYLRCALSYKNIIFK